MCKAGYRSKGGECFLWHKIGGEPKHMHRYTLLAREQVSKISTENLHALEEGEYYRKLGDQLLPFAF